jgi:transcriptional regulator with XRE-family HTH domain
MDEANQRQMLGAFIRAHRERLSPPKAGGRRRTPGLRREELADAAGLGVTWVTWLEQGREVNASVAALLRLADALQLSVAERQSLFDLAGKKDPEFSAEKDTDLLPSLVELPRLMSVPAYLLDHTWTARSWNQDAADLFLGWLDDISENRNLLHYVFLSQDAKKLIADWEVRALRLIAEFRADFNRRPGDEGMKELVDQLSKKSEFFFKNWNKHDVQHREGGERQFNHPVHGELKFMQTTLLVAVQQGVKLVCLAPV